MSTRGLDDFEGCPCLPAWTKDQQFCTIATGLQGKVEIAPASLMKQLPSSQRVYRCC